MSWYLLTLGSPQLASNTPMNAIGVIAPYKHFGKAPAELHARAEAKQS